MQIRKLLLPAIGGDLSDEVLRTALVAARRFEAHLEVLYARPDPHDMLHYDMSGASKRMLDSVLEAAQRQKETEAAQVRGRFESVCARWQIPLVGEGEPRSTVPSAAWREEIGGETEAVANRGRVSDLILVQGPVTVSPLSASVEAALRQTGRPVFLVPGEPAKTVGTHVAIGWNGTPEAARAVGAALPAPLQSAQQVSIFTTEKRMKIRPNGDDLADYLAWHGIATKIHLMDIRRRAVGETMLADARAQGVDLLLIGAYSHTRIRDMIFGGVTERVLATAEIPTVLAH